jgi:hypothetical protein
MMALAKTILAAVIADDPVGVLRCDPVMKVRCSFL